MDKDYVGASVYFLFVIAPFLLGALLLWLAEKLWGLKR